MRVGISILLAYLLVTATSASSRYRRPSRASAAQNGMARKGLSTSEQANYSEIDPESLCIKTSVLSIEDPQASKYGSMRGWMTQLDWNAFWKQIDSDEHRLTQVGIDGFPCAKKGCCEHSMKIRPGGSDGKVVQNVINEYAEFLKTLLPWQPRTILEGGGNIGVATTLFAYMYPDAKIIVMEAEPENCKVLKENTKDFKNVHVNCLGLWSKEGASVRLEEGGDKQSWGWRLVEVAEGTPGAIETTTVPALLKKYGLDGFDMAKIDIEGAEFSVLSPDTDTAWVADARVMMLEIHPWLGDADGLRARLGAQGFANNMSGEYDVFKRSDLGVQSQKHHLS